MADVKIRLIAQDFYNPALGDLHRRLQEMSDVLDSTRASTDWVREGMVLLDEQVGFVSRDLQLLQLSQVAWQEEIEKTIALEALAVVSLDDLRAQMDVSKVALIDYNTETRAGKEALFQFNEQPARASRLLAGTIMGGFGMQKGEWLLTKERLRRSAVN